MKRFRLLSVFFAALMLSLACAIGACASREPKMQFENLIRFEEPTGPRFSATLPRSVYDDEKLTEYGFIVISLEKYQAAVLSSTTFTLDADADFLRGINYGTVDGKKVDKHLSLDDSYVTFSCVITNISEEYFRKGIVARAYAIYDGKVYYSYRFKTSYLGNAKGIKNSQEYDTLDSDGKELIDYVLSYGDEHDQTINPDSATFILDEIMASPTLVKEYLIIPTNKREPHLVPEDASGEENLYVYAYVDGSTKYVPVYTDEAEPAIYDEENNVVTEQYDDKLCVYVVDENGLYHIRSLGYYEDENGDYAGLEKEDVSVLDSDEKNAMFYVDTQEDVTFENVVSTRYNVGFERELYLTEDMVFIVRSYDEDDDEYVYYIDNKDTAIYYNGCVFDTFTYIAYNRTSSNEHENFGVVFATYDESFVGKDGSYRIVSNHDLIMTDDGNWTISYEVYDPYTGKKVYDVPSSVEAAKASSLTALKAGTIVELVDGIVDETNPDTVLGSMSEENLVWIKQADEDGIMTIVPYDKNVSCRTCAEEYMEWHEDGTYRDIFGNEHTSGKLKTTKSTVFTRLSYGEYNSSFYNWSNMDITTYSSIANGKKEVLCYNDDSLDKEDNYITTYSDYVKAFVCATEDDTAYFVIVIVNGDEGAAYNVECEKHTDTSLTADMQEITEAYEPKRSGPAIAGASLTAEDI